MRSNWAKLGTVLSISTPTRVGGGEELYRRGEGHADALRPGLREPRKETEKQGETLVQRVNFARGDNAENTADASLVN